MRHTGSVLFLLLAGLAAFWALRPAALGDPYGAIAFVDRAVPELAALRIKYVPGAAAGNRGDAAPGSDQRQGTGSRDGRGQDGQPDVSKVALAPGQGDAAGGRSGGGANAGSGRQRGGDRVPGAGDAAPGPSSGQGNGPGAGAASGPGGGPGGAGGGARGGRPPKLPALVELAPAVTKSIPITIPASGKVEAMASIAVKPRVDSQVNSVAVDEGALVAKGALLFTLDDRQIKAQLDQNRAQVRKSQALVDQLTRNLARAEKLFKQQFLTAQAREDLITSLDSAKAQLAVDLAARSGLEASRDYMRITAPIAGRIGSISVRPGALTRTGEVLATINQVDPIYVSFGLPEARIGEVRAAMAAGTAKVSIREGEVSKAGVIAFMENAVDQASGTIVVKAAFPNPKEVLWPGAFAKVDVETAVEDRAIVVPSGAVLIGQNGNYVYGVANNKAVLKPVTVSRSLGAETIIASGLAAGDEIVVRGQGSLSDGAEVRLAPAGKTAAGKAPSDG